MPALDQRLHETITAAYENSPEVRGRLDAAGLTGNDIQTVADLARVPVLEKDDVIALQEANPPFGGLLAAPMSQIRHIFFSPGPLMSNSIARLLSSSIRRRTNNTDNLYNVHFTWGGVKSS